MLAVVAGTSGQRVEPVRPVDFGKDGPAMTKPTTRS